MCENCGNCCGCDQEKIQKNNVAEQEVLWLEHELVTKKTAGTLTRETLEDALRKITLIMSSEDILDKTLVTNSLNRVLQYIGNI